MLRQVAVQAVAYADLGRAGRLFAADGGKVAQRLLARLGRSLVDLLPQRVLRGGDR
ncbi:hypothetical protein ACFWJY_33950 [Streptomyces anulatus]|uniref:hypothetical protein n=1 Tax=Streptomyces anulatus TaxID=1892 RepID=UPI003668066D